jgi:hypothetical protein
MRPVHTRGSARQGPCGLVSALLPGQRPVLYCCRRMGRELHGRSEVVDVDDRLGEGLGGFLGQVVRKDLSWAGWPRVPPLVRYYRNRVFRAFFHASPENRLVRDRYRRLAAAAVLSRSARRSRLPDLLLCSSGPLFSGLGVQSPSRRTSERVHVPAGHEPDPAASRRSAYLSIFAGIQVPIQV